MWHSNRLNRHRWCWLETIIDVIELLKKWKKKYWFNDCQSRPLLLSIRSTIRQAIERRCSHRTQPWSSSHSQSIDFFCGFWKERRKKLHFKNEALRISVRKSISGYLVSLRQRSIQWKDNDLIINCQSSIPKFTLNLSLFVWKQITIKLSMKSS